MSTPTLVRGKTQLNIRLDTSNFALMAEAADREGISYSAYVRRILLAHLGVPQEPVYRRRSA